MIAVAAELHHFTSVRDDHGWVEVHHGDVLVERHRVTRWLREADAADRRLLEACTEPTLDVGCGPGRLIAALTAHGVPSLGIDISLEAVISTRALGGAALRRDVFAPIPGEGRWPWAVLADGNIGIGGDPARLLRRLTEILAPGGAAVVEVSTTEIDHRGMSRVRCPNGTFGPAFPWAVVGAAALSHLAAATQWQVCGDWQQDGRRVLTLRRP